MERRGEGDVEAEGRRVWGWKRCEAGESLTGDGLRA